MTIHSIIHSMRLRTLPLSLAGVILGLCLAAADADVPISVIIFTLLTTVSLQILANLSNELGDYLHGTDNEQRQGPQYSLQLGTLSVSDFKCLIAIMVALCCIFGTCLIYCSYHTLWGVQPILFFLLGCAAIWAAMHYTLGRSPYGYRGLGDLFVFLFFGLCSVAGTYFIATHTIAWYIFLAATAIGFFSVAVLNVNNIRDMQTDKSTRTTIPLRIGEKRAKIYQISLIFVGWCCIITLLIVQNYSLWTWTCLLTLPLYSKHLIGVWRHTDRALDPMLPLLVMTTFLFSLMLGIGLCL